MMKTALSAAALGLAAMAMPVQAQNQDGLVNVSIEDVNILRDSLNKNDLDLLNNLIDNNQVSVPVVVQVPLGIAANVCGVSAAVLGSSEDTPPSCTATTASRALGQAINDQVMKDATATAE